MDEPVFSFSEITLLDSGFCRNDVKHSGLPGSDEGLA